MDLARYKEVYSYKPTPSLPSFLISDDNKEGEKLKLFQEKSTCTMNTTFSLNLDALEKVFSRVDVDCLQLSAEKIISSDGVRTGFSDSAFLVKSVSQSDKIHSVQKYANGKYKCSKECLGFTSRSICAHTVAAAHFHWDLASFLLFFTISPQEPSLTKLTTFNVNKRAGSKRNPNTGRGKRKTSPDPMEAKKRKPLTLGDVLVGDKILPPNQTFSSKAISDTKLAIKVNAQVQRPPFVPTRHTPFDLVNIRGNIRICHGCRNFLKDGPDAYALVENDEALCIRHKEHDHQWVQGARGGFYKKTFDNKYYHIYRACLMGRNPHFDHTKLGFDFTGPVSNDLVDFLEERLKPNQVLFQGNSRLFYIFYICVTSVQAPSSQTESLKPVCRRTCPTTNITNLSL